MKEFIVIRGAREHNLKNINLSIPKEKATVITGPSGSGKSSLAIDTVYAEGQRRYVESLSAYARQFLDKIRKPEVDFIDGLSPSIAITQRTVSKSPRSTVGTITEIYDYMRVLYTNIGRALCYRCGLPVSSQKSEAIFETVMSLPRGTRLQVLSPIVRQRKGEYRKELQEMRAEGFIRARIDGEMTELSEDIKLKKHKRHDIEIVIDRLVIKPNMERQLKNAIDTALKYAETVLINLTDTSEDIAFSRKAACPACGISYPEIRPMFFSFNSSLGACPSCRGLGYESMEEGAEEIEGLLSCRECGGLRLRKEALSIKVGGLNIGEFAAMSVGGAMGFINGLDLGERERAISSRILKEVTERLSFLKKVGLGYLSLDRPSLTLSGGESQRIRLATQMGSSLTGVLYVLDEPSIGLHPSDCAKLLESLASIRDAGNTVVVVEHDEETIRWADHVIDMGPGAGLRGGWVVAEGSPGEIEKSEGSMTGKYLSGEFEIPVPFKRRAPSGEIGIFGARAFNLKNVDVKVPLGALTCVTGVSGSGKSTLVYEVLYKWLAPRLRDKGAKGDGRDMPVGEITGWEELDRAISVEQSPLGKTPRSNPATYTGVFTFIRDLFCRLQEARVRGYQSSRFSFNVSGGRCEACRGEGLKKVEMHFLPNCYVPCDSCRGLRYNKETLEVKFKGRSISDVLEMTVSEALEFFSALPAIRRRLEVLDDVGLGYIKLGQPATTLSGGEAQRVRLSRELGKRALGKTLYVLDEPTTGLHFADIERLLGVINRLVDRGNTVLVIEHNPDVVKSADYVIDLGPGGGEAGGMVVAEGTPEEVAKDPRSLTGRHLAKKLEVRRFLKATA